MKKLFNLPSEELIGQIVKEPTEFFQNLLTFYPGGKLRAHLKKAHHFDLNLLRG